MDFINYESDDDDDDNVGDSKLQKALTNPPKSMSETVDVKTNPILIPCSNNSTKHPLLSQLPTFVNDQSMNTETSRNIQDILDRESDFMQVCNHYSNKIINQRI